MTKSIEPRPLSSDEHLLVEFLLSAEFPGCDELKSQLGIVEVVGTCECGCGTVNLAVRGPAARAICREPIPIEAYGAGIQVLLFVRGGLLSSLEIVDLGDKRPLPYPRPRDLNLWAPPPRKPTVDSGP